MPSPKISSPSPARQINQLPWMNGQLPDVIADRGVELDDLIATYGKRYPAMNATTARRSAVIVLVYRQLLSAERTAATLGISDRTVRNTLPGVNEPMLGRGQSILPDTLQAEIAAVRGAYKRGHQTIQGIADELGWPLDRTQARFNAAGLQSVRTRKSTPAQRRNIERRLRAGQSMPSIAKTVGVSLGVVRAVNTRLELPARRPGVRAGLPLTAADVQPTVDLVNQGASVAQISRTLGLSANRVNRRITTARQLGLLPAQDSAAAART